MTQANSGDSPNSTWRRALNDAGAIHADALPGALGFREPRAPGIPISVSQHTQVGAKLAPTSVSQRVDGASSQTTVYR